MTSAAPPVERYHGGAIAYSTTDLGFCSNVFAGADWPAVEANLLGPIRDVRERRRLDRMTTGLWLSAAATAHLAADPAPLVDALATSGVDLVTLNGFPFGDFHAERVKQRVYTPAWDTPQRLDYTLDLARILVRCLPARAAFGTISTLPLGYAAQWHPDRHAAALAALCRLAAALARIADETGRAIRVCLEPEPDCVLEHTIQAIRLFTEELPAAAQRCGVARSAIESHLGLCFDVCHQAVQFEDIDASLRALASAGVTVGKVQVSSALELPEPAAAGALLGPFAEPRYLHQVRCRRADGRIVASPDLAQALADPDLPRDGPWRVHFHVPIQHPPQGADGLGTTAPAILQALDYLAAAPDHRPHLEVETYTWRVLPPEHRPRDTHTLTSGLCAELAWLETHLAERGLLDGDT
ncbi:hypothetical protein CKO31_05255 [Thiohalocapsa halophila]|uniref:TIM barrel protein n=1 Tax=Thiohalocapsa halophila TaxID=69359 RepID=A0ABS1CE35_9GAMM|nr:metabolite traffic protein EboE [Thiohalocapsa halophila]MBK1630158.1 hypothetical protein [Thiohalocapsa halophila]